MPKNNPINYSEFFNDDGAIDKLIDKLNEVDAVYNRLATDVSKSFNLMKKKAEEYDTTTEDGRKQIEKLEKELEKLIKANKILKDSEGELTDQKKRAIKLAKDEAKLLNKKNELTDQQTLKNIELKEEIREQNKVLKQQARENKGLVGEYERQSRLLIKLRKDYKNLAVAGLENTDSAHKLLLEVTELDAKLKDVDKSVGQTQRSVGDYRDAIKGAVADTGGYIGALTGAIDASGLLAEITSQLHGFMGLLKSAEQKLTTAFSENTKEVKANTILSKKQLLVAKAQIVQQKLLRASLNKTATAFKLFNNILKASIIGLIIVAVGSLVASLTKTQKGLNSLRAITLSTTAIISELADRLIQLVPAFKGLGALLIAPINIAYKGISALIDGFKFLGKAIDKSLSFGLNSKVNAEFDEALKSVEKSGGEFVTSMTDIPKNIKSVFAGITVFDGFLDKLNEIKKKAEPIVKELSKIEIKTVEDSLGLEKKIAELERLEEIEADSTRSLAERNEAIKKGAKLQKEIADENTLIAENKLKLFLIENKFTQQGIKFNSKLRKEQVELINGVTKAKSEGVVKELQIGKVSNQIDQDIAEQRLDILIDGFDKRKSLNEKIIDDETKGFIKRKKLLKDTEKLSNESLKAQVEIFNETAIKEINIAELVGEKNAVELVKKVEGYKLSEIMNTRLFEAIRERQQAEADFEEKANDLKKERIKSLQDSVKREIDLSLELLESDKLRAIEQIKLNQKVAVSEIDLKRVKYKGDIEIIQQLDSEKKSLIKKFEKEISDIRKDSIEQSIKNEEELTFGLIKDIEERELKQLESKKVLAIEEINKRIEENKKINKNDIELNKQLIDEKLALINKFNDEKNAILLAGEEKTNKKEMVLFEIELLKKNEKEKLSQQEINEKLRNQRIKDLKDEIDLAEELEINADDKKLERARLMARKEKDIQDAKEKDIAYLRKLASDTAFNIFNDRINKEISLLDKKIVSENKQITKQEELAKEGLSNTLAFEQSELAKLELQKIQAQKKQIQLEKVRALYSGYVANTNSGTMTSSEALIRAFRDFGIITGLELGLTKLGTGTGAGNFDEFFKSGENGSKGGNSLQNGVFKGDSHNAKSGGIPLLVERDEALMDSNRMGKFGQQNWNKLIHGIDSGAIGSDFMNQQVQSIPILGGVSINFKGLENSINDVKKTIENKPIQEVNVEQISDLYADFIDKKTVGNKITISRFRVPKKRF